MNCLVMKGMNFSDSGLGRILNESLSKSDLIIHKNVGFISADGAVVENTGWGQVLCYTDLITIPENTIKFVTYTNMVKVRAENLHFLPGVFFYDDEDKFISSISSFASVDREYNPSFETGGNPVDHPIVQGYIIADVPSGATKMRLQWQYYSSVSSYIVMDYPDKMTFVM